MEEQKQIEILWSPRQLADYIGISMVTMYRWIKKGEIIDKSKIVLIGKRIRIPRSEVERIAGITKEKLKG